MSAALQWARDGHDWPNAQASRFIDAGHLRWHVQTLTPPDETTDPPTLLLIHGTGASTHSWRDLAPLLAQRYRVVALDLPGHGFTERPPAARLSLSGMARAVAALLQKLTISPDVVIGHSAGAAILARLCLDRTITPAALISLNGALLPFGGRAGKTLPQLAKLLFANPFVPRIFALGAGRPQRVARLIENTGSTLDERGLALYALLFASADHAGAALGMMARWELDELAASLDRLPVALWLVVGLNDRAIAPSEAERLAQRVPGAHIERLDGLGHLAHEEAPDRCAALINDIIDTVARRPRTHD